MRARGTWLRDSARGSKGDEGVEVLVGKLVLEPDVSVDNGGELGCQMSMARNMVSC